MKWNSAGLVPAIIQDSRSGAVRMLGWMNAESLERTRQSGHVWFWSRSRQTLWKKGETSGNTLDVVEIRDDCDHDALLIRVVPHGPTCHTGSSSCFANVLGGARSNGLDDASDDDPNGGLDHELQRLEATLIERRAADPSSSYTASLLASGADAINEKIREESTELNRGPGWRDRRTRHLGGR